jgi:type IV pilus assembly protein PilA
MNTNLLRTRKTQAGFSLIELLVVVAVRLVLAALAVPAVIASGQASNESAAANTLKQVASAEVGYHQLYNVYPATAASLGGGESTTGCPAIPTTTGGCFINDGIAKQLDAGTLSGYSFKYVAPTDGQEWAMSATPSSAYSGRKSYFITQSGSVSYSNGTTAMTAPGTPLGQ